MKPHSTIPANSNNLQPATCPRRIPRRSPRRSPSRFHFQFLIFNFALLIALACSDETVDQPDTPQLAANERLVEIVLPGLSAGSNTAATAATNISRAAADNIALAAENQIKQLTVLCFVNLATNGSDATTLDDYTLEREYAYISEGDANDMTLAAEADGYRAGIGVPKDDTRKRAFLLKANQTDAGSITYTAVPVSDPNRGSATTYAAALNETSASLPNGTNPSCPLLMSARATHTVITGAGEFIADPVFTQEDLAKGISARITRRVARIDISNPGITGFTVTGIQGSSLILAPLFKDNLSGYLNKAGTAITLTNAAIIPAALYLYPPKTGSQAGITLSGIYAGNPVTLATTATLLPNTRYTLAVRNDESNLRLDISVAPWNDGDTIDTPDVGNATYNSHVTFEGSSYQFGVFTIDTVNRTLTYTAATFKNENELLILRGAAGDRNPIGIIIPEDSWIALSPVHTGEYDEATGYYTLKIYILDPTDSGRDGLCSTPRGTPLTIVTRDAGGRTKYSEYTIRQELCDPADAPASQPLTLGFLGNLGSIDEANRIIHLPPLAGAEIIAPEGKKTMGRLGKQYSYFFAYPKENYPWLEYTEAIAAEDQTYTRYCCYSTSSSNLGGTPRTGYLLNRSINTDDEQVTERWTVIQDATLDESLLAADVDISLLVKPERELHLSGDTVYIDYGTLDAFAYRSYLDLRDTPSAQTRLEYMLDIMGNTITAKGIGNRPMYATTATDWIRIASGTDDDGTDRIIIRPLAYPPYGTTNDDGSVTTQPTETRFGTVTLHLRDGKTRTLVLRQEAITIEN